MSDKIVIPENLLATLAIVGRGDSIKEPMNGDEVDALCEVIKRELNKHEGNIAENYSVHIFIAKKDGYMTFRDSEGSAGSTPGEDIEEFKKYWIDYHYPVKVTFEEV